MQCFLQRNIKFFHVSRETISFEKLYVSRETIKKNKGKKVSRETSLSGEIVSRETFCCFTEVFSKLLHKHADIALEALV